MDEPKSEGTDTMDLPGLVPLHTTLTTLHYEEIKLVLSCPYDYRPVCKHIVATLYALIERTETEFAGNKQEKSSYPNSSVEF